MNTEQFTKKYYTKRKGTDCIKWDSPDIYNNLPMFIADMDFKADQKIIDALNKRINHGVYGYTFLPKDYNDLYVKWYQRHQGVTYDKNTIRFSKGAVDGLYQLIYALTKEKDAVLITTPVYHPFAATINQTKRTLVTSPLDNKNGLFTFNYQDLEKKFKEKKVKMMVLCSPHNPLGRVWNKVELENLFKLTHKYHVIVISDEVHSDLIMPGNKFIPSYAFEKYRDDIISLNALSKTLSLAIFNHCHVIIPNKKYRDIFDKYQEDHHLQPVNAFSAYPTYYGFKYGDQWLKDVLNVLNENYKYFVSRLAKYVEIAPLQGTYLLFVNFKGYTHNGYKFLLNKCHIKSNAGETFGKGYDTWARINLATSKANVKKACDAIEKEIKSIIK